MNRFHSLLALGVLATASTSGAVAAPEKAPLSSAWSCYAPEGTLLGYYDRIPARHFAGFGGINRRSLLKRQGAIVDYKRKFIQIPSHPSGKGDIQMLQVSLLPNGKEPWVAVSRIVRSRQNRVPGTLNFYYGYNDAGGLREAAATFFPYKLKKQRGFFENAYLPRKGLTIQFGLTEHDVSGPRFTYSPNPGVEGNFFVRTG